MNIHQGIILLCMVSLNFSGWAHAGTYGDQLRQQAAAEERNRHLHGFGGATSHGAQLYAQGRYINRMTDYFSPQGVNVYQSRQLERAMLLDQRDRTMAFSALNAGVQNRISDIGERQHQITGRLFDAQGQLTTYDKGTLRESSAKLRGLNQEAGDLEKHVDVEFREQARVQAVAPYMERPDMAEAFQNTERLADTYIKGTPTGFKGIQGMRGNLATTADALWDTARKVEEAEDRKREQIVQSYAITTVAVAAAAFTGGSSLLLAKVALGATLAGSAASLGNSVRNHVILNERGYEGLRSGAEAQAQMGVQAFQHLTTAISMGANLYSMAGKVNALQGANGVTGFSALRLSEKLYYGQHYVQAVAQASEMSGLTREALGERGATYVNAGLAATNLAFSATGVTRSFNAKLAYQQHDVSSAMVDTAIQSSDKEMRNIVLNLGSSNRAEQLKDGLSQAIAIARISPEAERWLQEQNGVLSAGMAGLSILSHASQKAPKVDQMAKAGLVKIAYGYGLYSEVNHYEPIETDRMSLRFIDLEKIRTARGQAASKAMSLLVSQKEEMKASNYTKLETGKIKAPIPEGKNVYYVVGRDSEEMSRVYQDARQHREAIIPDLKRSHTSITLTGFEDYKDMEGFLNEK